MAHDGPRVARMTGVAGIETAGAWSLGEGNGRGSKSHLPSFHVSRGRFVGSTRCWSSTLGVASRISSSPPGLFRLGPTLAPHPPRTCNMRDLLTLSALGADRQVERRVGKDCVRSCSYWWSPPSSKK